VAKPAADVAPTATPTAPAAIKADPKAAPAPEPVAPKPVLDQPGESSTLKNQGEQILVDKVKFCFFLTLIKIL